MALLFVLASQALTGCSGGFDDLDMSEFEALPVLASFDLSHLRTPSDPTYVEVWQNFQVEPEAPIIVYGERCAEAGDQAACQADFEVVLGSEDRFPSCGDAPCRSFLMVNEGDSNSKVGDIGQLTAFFGTVDAPEEAALIAAALGYEWNGLSIGESSYREIGGGYQLIVTRLTNDCLPVQVSRFLLEVLADGTLTVEDEEVLYEDDGACAS